MVYLIWEAFKREPIERKKIFAIIILTFFSVIFWAFFEQAGTSISLFVKKCLNRNILGFEIVPSAFQSVNPGYIILLAPFMSYFWGFLDSIKIKVNVPQKFALGMFLLGNGFWIFGISYKFSDSNGIVPLHFFMIGYLILTIGELCLSPIGLSMITEIAPKGLTSILMGIWLLSSSFAHSLGSVFAKTTSMDKDLVGLEALQIYTTFFTKIGITAMACGLFLFFISPFLQKWINPQIQRN
jgi:POT family proton-dependent oligopeptide transporter